MAELLSNITSSKIFDDILVTQLNNVLNNFGITLNSQMIVNVKSEQEWANELVILQDICRLYKDYTSENKAKYKKLVNKKVNIVLSLYP